MAEFRLKIAIIFLSTQVHGRAPHGFCARRDLVTGPPDGLLRPAVFVRMGPAGVDPRPVQPEPEVKLELVEFQFLFFFVTSTAPLGTLFFFFFMQQSVIFCFVFRPAFVLFLFLCRSLQENTATWRKIAALFTGRWGCTCTSRTS